MTYHRELCLFPAIIQIAFGDVNSSRLINHASWDGLTLRMSNAIVRHLFSRVSPCKLGKNLSPIFQDVTQMHAKEVFLPPIFRNAICCCTWLAISISTDVLAWLTFGELLVPPVPAKLTRDLAGPGTWSKFCVAVCQLVFNARCIEKVWLGSSWQTVLPSPSSTWVQCQTRKLDKERA